MLIMDQLNNPPALSATEQRIVDYILVHPEEVCEQSIQALAKATYTSHSAVVRLAKKLGFDGFVAFRHELTKAVQAAQNQQNPVDPNFPFKPNDSAMAIAKNMADLTVNTITRTQWQFDEVILAKAATLLTQASRIIIFALGDSQIRARSFQNKLVKINKFVVIADEYNDETWVAANLAAGDLAIFLSYSGDIPQQIKIASFMAHRHVKIMVLTGNPDSPLKQYAALTLAAKQTEFDILKVGTFASQIAFEYMLNTLFAIVYARQYQEYLGKLKTNYDAMRQGDIQAPQRPKS